MNSVANKRSLPSRTLWQGRKASCEVWSSLGAIEGLCKVLRHFLIDMGEPEMVFAAEIVARECMNNAVFHGNRGQSAQRMSLDVAIGRKWMSLRVTDQGKGFNWRKVMAANIPDHDKVMGRGLPIVRSYSERMAFNNSGNQITVWIKKPSRRRER